MRQAQTQAQIAEGIARQAHVGQTDRGGHPYIGHPAHVAAEVARRAQADGLPEDTVDRLAAVAWLHDTLEDTPTTADDLRAAGIDEDVVQGVLGMTKRPDEHGADRYLDYVRRVAANPLSRRVKQCDLENNMDLSRLGHEPTPEDLARVARYREAHKIITAAIEEAR